MKNTKAELINPGQITPLLLNIPLHRETHTLPTLNTAISLEESCAELLQAVRHPFSQACVWTVNASPVTGVGARLTPQSHNIEFTVPAHRSSRRHSHSHAGALTRTHARTHTRADPRLASTCCDSAARFSASVSPLAAPLTRGRSPVNAAPSVVI